MSEDFDRLSVEHCLFPACLSASVCDVIRKQHSLWVQGDVHRSKQKLVQQRLSRKQQLQAQQQQLQQSRQQQQQQTGQTNPSSEEAGQEAMSRLLSSMDDLSIKTTLYKSYSLDEVRSRSPSVSWTITANSHKNLPFS